MKLETPINANYAATVVRFPELLVYGETLTLIVCK